MEEEDLPAMLQTLIEEVPPEYLTDPLIATAMHQAGGKLPSYLVGN